MRHLTWLVVGAISLDKVRALTSVFSMNMPMSFTLPIAYSEMPNDMIDGNYDHCLNILAGATAGQVFQVDMQSSKKIGSLYTSVDLPNQTFQWTIYIGDYDYQSSYQTKNQACYSGYLEGLATCKGSGRYIIFELNSATTTADLKIFELIAFLETDFAGLGTVSSGNMVLMNGVLSRLIGTTIGTDRWVGARAVTGSTFTIYVSFSTTRPINEVAFFVTRQLNSWMQYVTVFGSLNGKPTLCGTIYRDETLLFQSVTCPSVQLVDSVQFVFSAGGADLQYLVKLATFGPACFDDPKTITENPYNANIVYNLLIDVKKFVPVPTLTITPTPCYTTTWTAYRALSNTNLVVSDPSVYAFSADLLNLEVTVAPSDLTQRLSLGGQMQQFYFKGITNTFPSSATSDLQFSIYFQDDCRTSTITANTITLVPVKFGTSHSQQVAAFRDSVDAYGSYSLGICGEKAVSLDAGTPAFLSLSADTVDPILNPLQIVYDASSSLETDIGVHTINYTVKSLKYAGLVPDLTGTFSFEIQCPNAVISSSLVSSVAATSNYDLASGRSLILAAPVVALSPSNCFAISTYEVTDNTSGQAVPYITLSPAVNPSFVVVQSADWSLFGPHTLRIVAVTNNGEKKESHTFSVIFFDTCSTLVPSLIESAQPGLSLTFDLLADSSKSIALPTVAVLPIGCNFTVAWVAMRLSDDKNMVVDYPASFALVGSSLIVSHTVTDFTARKFWVGHSQYYFQGTVSDAGRSQTTRQTFSIEFRDACRSATVTPQTILFPNQVARFQSTLSITVPQFTDTVGSSVVYSANVCGDKLVVLDANAPPFISLKANPIGNTHTIIYTDSLVTNDAVLKVHNIPYTVSFREYSGIAANHASTFSVTIECPSKVNSISLDVPVKPQNAYDVADPGRLSIAAPIVTFGFPKCFHVVGYQIYSAIGPPLTPTFVSVSEDLKNIIVGTNDRRYVGTHPLRIKVLTDSKEALVEHGFTLTIYDSCNQTQVLNSTGAALGNIKVQAQSEEPLIVNFTAYTDSVSVNYGKADVCGSLLYSIASQGGQDTSYFAEVVKLESSWALRVNSVKLKSQSSMSLILRVQLVDYPDVAAAEQRFVLEILAPVSQWQPPPPKENPVQKEEKVPLVVEDPPSRRPIEVHNITNGEEEVEEEEIVAAADLLANEIREMVSEDQLSQPYPVPYIRRVTVTGLLEIAFTKPMQQLPSEIDLTSLKFQASPGHWAPVLNVTVLPSANQDLSNVQLKWSVLEYSPKKLLLRLEFKEPLKISYEKPDLLVVVFADSDLFISDQGIRIPTQSRTLSRNLMRQLPPDAQQLQESLDSGANASKTSSFIMLTLNFFLKAGMQQIFGMLQALQLIVILPVFQTQIPANAGSFFGTLLEIVSFDVIDIGDYVSDFLGVEPTEPVNERFEMIGFSSKQFIDNVGSFIFVLIIYFLAVLLWAICTFAGKFCACAETIGNYLQKFLFWDNILAVVNESFLIIATCGCISLNYNLAFTSAGQTTQSMIALTTICAYVLVLALAFASLLRNFPTEAELKTKKNDAQFYKMLDGLDVRRGRKILFEPLGFIGIRATLAILVIFGSEVFMYQMIVLFWVQLATLVSPFMTEAIALPSERRIQTFSKFSVLVCSYFFLMFNMVDVDTNFQVGYATIGVVCVYMGVNFAFIISDVFRAYRLKVLLRWALHKHKRYRDQVKTGLKQTRELRRWKRAQRRWSALSEREEESSASVEDSSSGSDRESSARARVSNATIDEVSQEDDQSYDSEVVQDSAILDSSSARKSISCKKLENKERIQRPERNSPSDASPEDYGGSQVNNSPALTASDQAGQGISIQLSQTRLPDQETSPMLCPESAFEDLNSAQRSEVPFGQTAKETQNEKPVVDAELVEEFRHLSRPMCAESFEANPVDQMLIEAKEILGPDDESLREVKPLGLLTLKRANIREESDIDVASAAVARLYPKSNQVIDAYKIGHKMLTIDKPILVRQSRRKPILNTPL